MILLSACLIASNFISSQVADFAGAALNILDRNLRGMFETTKSTCLAPCTECVNNAMNFTYIAGDILLGGE